MAPITLRVHDLVRFPTSEASGALPNWLASEDAQAWAVVRRQPAVTSGAVSVGLRGQDRSQRTAVDIPVAAITRVVTPEALTGKPLQSTGNRGLRDGLVDLARMITVAFPDLRFGITGSTGYELSTGHRAVSTTSDLDLIIRCVEPLSRDLARDVQWSLSQLPCRADCLLETPNGAVALDEWAEPTTKLVLLRTPSGPTLVDDPWVQETTLVRAQ